MSRTRIISSSALACAVGLAAIAFGAEKDPPTRIVRPEGYIQIEPADAGSAGGGFSIAPAVHSKDAPTTDTEPVEVPASKISKDACEPIAERFIARLAEVRGRTDAGVLDPAIQRAMFGRVALSALSADPSQLVPEATWDADLKDLRRAYLRCVKAVPAK